MLIEIYIDNIWKLKKKKDCNNKLISYYAPKYFADDKPIQYLKGKRMRIFCNECVANKQLKKCLMCPKKDTINTKSCLMHTCCPKCGGSVNNNNYDHKCGKCRKVYCSKHIRHHTHNPQCINCYIRTEYITIFIIIPYIILLFIYKLEPPWLFTSDK